MGVFLGILSLLAAFVTGALISFEPKTSKLSNFELKRLLSTSEVYSRELLRRKNKKIVTMLSKLLAVLLIIGELVLLSNSLSWLPTLLLATVFALIVFFLSILPLTQKISNKMFVLVENKIYVFIEKTKKFWRSFSYFRSNLTDGRIDSVEHLINLLEVSGGAVSESEKELIFKSLKFNKRLISEVTTPMSKVHTINHDELLGPLVLNELHEAGVVELPVVRAGTDNIIGILDLGALLSLDVRRSVTAEKAMDKNFHKINKDETLSAALNKFLQSKKRLFVVTGGDDKIIGIVSIHDVINQLINVQMTSEVVQ